jgi:hypothetical protein
MTDRLDWQCGRKNRKRKWRLTEGLLSETSFHHFPPYLPPYLIFMFNSSLQFPLCKKTLRSRRTTAFQKVSN